MPSIVIIDPDLLNHKKSSFTIDTHSDSPPTTINRTKTIHVFNILVIICHLHIKP